MGERGLREWWEQVSFSFPPEWIKAALVLALISTWVVVALFALLNHTTRRRYFSLWTVAWIFYALYLAASIGLLENPESPWLLMARSSCVGISALFMFWGSFELLLHGRQVREVAFGSVMIVVWSYIAAFHVQDRFWISLPVFTLLGGAGLYTGYAYWRRRGRYIGGIILSSGFGLWGLHLLFFPLADRNAHTTALAYLASAMVAMMIIVGMVTENETNTSENNYRELFDLARDAMFLLEPRTLQIVEANLAATVLLGRSCTELVNQPIHRFLPDLRSEDDAAALLQKVNAPLAELTIPLPDGSVVIAEARANLTTCPKGEVIELTVRDITLHKHIEQSLRETAQKLERTLEELRRTQQQLVRQERLRALEQMASGVAHDFNNALAKIIGFNELLLAWPENLADKDKVKKFLQMSNAAARDAVQIVNRLREFYRHRKTTDVYQAVDLHQVIEQAIVLTQPRWKDQMLAAGATIRIELDLQEVAPVNGSATDLREALINLLFNAVDALPEGGEITIGTRQNGDVVELFVRDNGVGMTEEVRQRCLEPFFSTKEKQGTGLGLAIVYGVVQRHGGTIEIESAPQQGTTVRIRLPAQAAAGSAALPPTHEIPPLRMLLVEDDPAVLDFEAQFLRQDRHYVETATSGKGGWEKFQQHRFDLVIADRALPDLNGDQLAAAVKRARPDVGVLIVTGFADGRETVADLVLPKPITHEALRQAVHQLYRQFLVKEQAA